MTNEQIIWGIAFALISAILNKLINMYVNKYIPNTKVLESYIIKLVIFISRYILPVSMIVYSFLECDFGKQFVLNILIYLFCFVYSLASDIMFRIEKKMTGNYEKMKEELKMHNEINDRTIQLINELVSIELEKDTDDIETRKKIVKLHYMLQSSLEYYKTSKSTQKQIANT